uniref:SnoaL-like domain-containing protein n=1 Tax=Odontella aurita TaxID=265563 RepID=A0A7S4J116_9STRA
MDGASSCFLDDGLEYDDAQFLGTIRSRRDLRRRFELGAAALPRDAVVIADEVASCEATGNVGARWHLERKGDGSTIPGTSGCSFYTTDPSTGLIRTGFKATEMVFKPDKTFADRVVASASTFTGGSATGPRAASSPSPSPAKPEGRAPSIIETYYEAWNRRDLESALDCVSDDCVYETEDPLFVSVLRGKDELRSHLEKNAASLPPSARIVLDDLAIDGANGNIGARWHLEVNGFAVPNLRGCSMYATDAETGLLKGGYDVTEAPVKIPGPALGLLAVPSMLGLIR